MTMTRAGIVGLGMIGAGVARSLGNSGSRAVGYDVRPEAAQALADVLDAASSPAEVARRSDVVHVAVLDAAQAAAVLSGPDGVLAGAHDGTVVLVLSTLSPAGLADLVALGEAAGVPVLDCGVMRGDLADRNGLVASVGGEEAVVESVRPVVEAWAARLVHCGPVGAGMTVKIGRNAVTFGMWRALEETTRMMIAAGVREDDFIAALEASDPAGELLFQQRRLIGDAPAGTPAREAAVAQGRAIMTKDMAAVAELAGRAGVATPMLDVVRREVDDSLDGYHG